MSITEAIGSRVEPIRIAANEWRVTRTLPDRRHASVVVAFVEQIGDVFGIMVIGKPLERAYVATFEEALTMIDRIDPDFRRDSGV